MLPKGWEICTASDICQSISVGIVVKPSQYYVSQENGIKAFRSANVREGFINDSNWVYLSKEGHDANKKSKLREGDVLIVRTGYPGTACVVTKEFSDSNAIDIVIARPETGKVLPSYLCAFTNSEYGKAQVLNLQGGMAQQHLNVGAYQELKIKLPPLHEQKEIANILRTWDKAIFTTEQLLANSQKQKKALMQKLLTGKKRFPQFGDKWHKTRLGDVAEMNSGGTPKSTSVEYYGGNIPWVSIADMTAQGKRIFSTERNLTQLGLDNSSARIYPKKTILYAMYASIGECSIAEVPLASSQAILGIRPNETLDHLYLYFYLSNLKEKIKLQGQQGTQSNLNAGMVKDFILPLPPIDEQKKISALLTIADNEIEIIEKRLNYLQKEKNALMQQLLTGKRRVNLGNQG